MDLLKDRIRADGRVIGQHVLKVDSFLNHQLDPQFIRAMGQAFAERFRDAGVTKILTIEASGIAIALMAGLEMGVPVLFAKKSGSHTQSPDLYTAAVASFTRGETVTITASKRYLGTTDRILILDDFLAMGEATSGLISLIEQAGAHLVGVGIVIEKGFQPGGRLLRARGIDLHSLCVIDSMSDAGITFSSDSIGPTSPLKGYTYA